MKSIQTKCNVRIASSCLLVVLAFLFSCTKENNENNSPLDKLIRPAHFPPAHYTHSSNPYSKAGFELGKKLFFDPILSRDSTISCASCHHQAHAFADRGVKFSTGIRGGISQRNSPAIFNMAWNTSFMWDGGINHIEIMPFAPLIHPLEMDDDLNNILLKLNRHSSYPKLFNEVFRKSKLDDQQLFWALAQYMGNLVSCNSRYDQYMLGKIALSHSELAGLEIFRKHCTSCHTEPLMTDYQFHNNGLDTQFKDVGRYRISQNSIDIGRFKTPSLRNIALTSPYMHDGRFSSLESVIHHYSHHILPSASLSNELSDKVGGFQFTDLEKKNLIDFLHTLSDNEFINDKHLVP